MFRKDEILLVYDFLGVILKTKQKKKTNRVWHSKLRVKKIILLGIK